MTDWSNLSLTAKSRKTLETELDAARGDYQKTMQGLDEYADTLASELFDFDHPDKSLALTDPDSIIDAARNLVEVAQEAADTRYGVQRQAWQQAAGKEFPEYALPDREDWTRVMWDVQKGFANTDYNGLTYRQVMAGKARSGASIMDLLPKTAGMSVDDMQQAYADFFRNMAAHAAQRRQMANIANDPTRPRWARVPRGSVTCAFCTMLAGRGFVYTSEEAAGGGLGNVYHAHCDCEPVPTWGEAKLTGYDITRYEGMYRSACKVLGDGASSQSICGWIRSHFPVSDALVSEMRYRGVSSVDGCVNWEQRANYMRKKWGVVMDKGIGSLPGDCQKAIVGGIDDALALRPSMKGAVALVRLAHPGEEGFNEKSYADMSYWNGVMRCSDVWFADNKVLAAQYAYDVSQGFHVRNTTPRSITAHETAHAIEYIAYLRATNQKNDAAAVHAFSGLAESNIVINPTARRILAEHNRGVEDLATEISRYARYQGQLHETIAEAYVDVIYNGNQASALSLDIIDAFIDNRGH